jgi:hypothetical protein
VAQWRKPVHPIWRAPPTVACRGEDTSLFYKGEAETPEARQVRTGKAKGLCQVCHAAAECLEAAMEEERSGGARFGIRGGYTEEGRRRLQVSRTLKARRAQENGEKETGEAA